MTEQGPSLRLICRNTPIILNLPFDRLRRRGEADDVILEMGEATGLHVPIAAAIANAQRLGDPHRGARSTTAAFSLLMAPDAPDIASGSLSPDHFRNSYNSTDRIRQSFYCQ
jgi:hypothetical protein